MTALIDYGAGNLKSVFNALDILGEECRVTSSADDLREADRIILPGVGAFGECIRNFTASGLRPVLDEQVLEKKKPFLGICVGMQMLASKGYEMGEHDGLNYIPGEIRKLETTIQELKVPHTGWNEITVLNDHPLLRGIMVDRAFYFTHSYHFIAADQADVAATTDFGGTMVAAIARENIFASQFHPEKSQRNGLRLLENFLSWSP